MIYSCVVFQFQYDIAYLLGFDESPDYVDVSGAPWFQGSIINVEAEEGIDEVGEPSIT